MVPPVEAMSCKLSTENVLHEDIIYNLGQNISREHRVENLTEDGEAAITNIDHISKRLDKERRRKRKGATEGSGRRGFCFEWEKLEQVNVIWNLPASERLR